MEKELNSQQQEEFTRIMDNLCVMPGFNTTTTAAIAKKVINHDFIFCQGEIYDVYAKSKGLGIYKVWSEKRKYP